MDEILIMTLVLVIVNGVFDAVVVAWLAGKRSRQAIMKLIDEAAEGDEEAMEFLFKLGDVLIKWAVDPHIKTGNRQKVATDKVDAEGNPIYKEVDEIVSPFDVLGSKVGNYAVMHMKGFMGGKKTQMQNQMAEAMAQSGGDVRALIPMALQAASRGDYGPAIGIIMQKLLSEGGPLSTQGGGSKW